MSKEIEKEVAMALEFAEILKEDLPLLIEPKPWMHWYIAMANKIKELETLE